MPSQSLKGIAERSAGILASEMFSWRFGTFHNRREVAAGRVNPDAPYDSGASQREQGVSNAGNKRVRRVAMELAWHWLRYQRVERGRLRTRMLSLLFAVRVSGQPLALGLVANCH